MSVSARLRHDVDRWIGTGLISANEIDAIAITRVQATDGHRKIITADDVVFFGDDVTDEDVFAVLRAGDIGVRVGPEYSLAQYRVGGPDGVAEALQLLLSERHPFRR